jgi:hypothetical protein
LRSYQDGGEHYAGQIGSEATPQAFIDALLAVTAECARVLKPSGSMFVNLGDKYAGSGGHNNAGVSGGPSQLQGASQRRVPVERAARSIEVAPESRENSHATRRSAPDRYNQATNAPAKSLMLLPERYRIGCVDQLGLIARAVIVWDKPNCLSGGTMVYARIKGRPTSIRVHDLCRAYRPEHVQLWNGERWTQVVWWQPTPRTDDGQVEIEFRSGDRVGCTTEHRWPVIGHGNVPASGLHIGDVIETCELPEGDATPNLLDDDMIGWFVGLHIAEGSWSEQTIQIAGHVNEIERYKRLAALAEALHGTCRVHATGGNTATINLTGPFIRAIVETYVGGRTAKDKHLAPKCWQRSNRFLRSVLDGYLAGDGHREGNRWRVGFTANDALASDLRTIGARLGLSVRLRRATHIGFGQGWPGWKGSITEQRRQPDSEVIAIRSSRARQFWDIGVADDPHLFALASGILTHNSLPESVTDRVRRSHEDWVHLTKAPRYYAAVDEIREAYADPIDFRAGTGNGGKAGVVVSVGDDRTQRNDGIIGTRQPRSPLGKLPGSVWRIPSEPLQVPAHLGVDHYAAFPQEWPRRIILGWSSPGYCTECGQARTAVVNRPGGSQGTSGDALAGRSGNGPERNRLYRERVARGEKATITGYSCACPTPNAPTRPAVVLDPFVGTGTTVMVARALGRFGVGVDLSADYLRLARWRIYQSGHAAKTMRRTWTERQGSLL